jgi:hydrogenase 3 maturation protease
MDLEEQLGAGLRGDVVVIGIGNPLRGDDAAGSLVARRVSNTPGVFVIDAEEVPENCLQVVVNRQPETIVLIDAVAMGSEPGSVALLDRNQLAGYWPSTHRVPVSLLVSVLGRETRARIFLIGIQPAHTEFLKPVSAAVAASVAEVAGMLNRALAGDFPAAKSELARSLRGEVPS